MAPRSLPRFIRTAGSTGAPWRNATRSRKRSHATLRSRTPPRRLYEKSAGRPERVWAQRMPPRPAFVRRRRWSLSGGDSTCQPGSLLMPCAMPGAATCADMRRRSSVENCRRSGSEGPPGFAGVMGGVRSSPLLAHARGTGDESRIPEETLVSLAAGGGVWS